MLAKVTELFQKSTSKISSNNLQKLPPKNKGKGTLLEKELLRKLLKILKKGNYSFISIVE